MSQGGFRIREFRRGDFNALWEIDQKCFPQGISYSQIELLTYMRRLRSFTLVAERIEEYHQLGVDSFILSGFPHLEESIHVGAEVLPLLRRIGASGRDVEVGRG